MLAHLLQVSLIGGLLILAVWSLCRLFPRLPAALRCWAWGLVCLEMLIGLFWRMPINLPVLPPSPPSLQVQNIVKEMHYPQDSAWFFSNETPTAFTKSDDEKKAGDVIEKRIGAMTEGSGATLASESYSEAQPDLWISGALVGWMCIILLQLTTLALQ